jgi:glyoxylase-like metal-dependent hydrolase (beta-lactamase superfamily II)
VGKDSGGTAAHHMIDTTAVHTTTRVGAGVLLLVLGTIVGETRARQLPRDSRIQQITGDLYMISGEGGNLAVYVTAEGVILVDDMYERNYADVVAHVKTVTSQPVRYVLNTHHHDDHAGGNVGALAGGVDVVAHRNVRSTMTRLKQPGLPRITFSDQMAVFLGGKEVRSYHFGRGHTDGDAIVHFPAERVIHTGDLFLARPPGAPGLHLYFDYANGGSAVEWSQTLGEAMKLDFATVIPGHGAVSTRADVETWLTDLDAMRSHLRDLIGQGRQREEIANVLIDQYRWPAGGLALAQLDALIAELMP